MGPSGRIGHILYILDCLGQVYAGLYLGRAPRTKETLPDILKWRRVTRPPLVFRGLTGSQRTPGFWGVTAFLVRAPPPGPLRRGVVPLTGYPPSSQGFLSPPWARTWDHELRYSFEVVPTTNWASSSVGSGNYPEWVSKLMVPGSSPRRRKKPL